MRGISIYVYLGVEKGFCRDSLLPLKIRVFSRAVLSFMCCVMV